MAQRLVTVSKFLSKHLRHAPEQLGIVLEPGGWVRVDELLAGCDRVGFPIARDELLQCVRTSDKQRFALDDAGQRIRANQGHSTAVDLEFEEQTPPALLYHGTVERFLASILSEGLRRGKRHHVHLSADIETARKVGARRGTPVLLAVDAAGMHAEKFAFYRSANGVWLTDHVPPRFLSRR